MLNFLENSNDAFGLKSALFFKLRIRFLLFLPFKQYPLLQNMSRNEPLRWIWNYSISTKSMEMPQSIVRSKAFKRNLEHKKWYPANHTLCFKICQEMCLSSEFEVLRESLKSPKIFSFYSMHVRMRINLVDPSKAFIMSSTYPYVPMYH